MQKFITYKNSRIAFSCEGKGNAIVFLHGFLENSTMWKDIKNQFLSENRVITIDLLGHGNSDCFGYIHTMELMADFVKQVIDFLKIEEINFVGHSMGGYVSLAFAEQYPKYVKKICLINSTSQGDDINRKNIRKRAIEMAKTNYHPLVKMSITNLFSKDTSNLFKAEIEHCKSVALKTSIQTYIATSEGLKIRKSRESVLQSNLYKKLIISGKKDPILSSQNLKEEADKTNSSFLELSNGHMSHIENKKELINALKKFI